MIKIMEKNYFAAIDYRTGMAIGIAIIGLLFGALTIIGPLSGTWSGLAVPVAWFSMFLPALVCARRVGWGIGAALMTPLVYPLLFYALVNSAVVTLRHGGIRWRNTFYSIDQLRAGGVRANTCQDSL
jgi:hypothetical protein